jgi:hypothetical protein
MIQHKKSLVLLSVLCMAVLLLSRCESSEIISNDPRGPGFAGSAACKKCHSAEYDAYIASTHFNSTQPDSIKTTQGSFKFNDSTQVLVQKRDSGLYQIAYVNGKETEAHRMDIAFGLKHAQTFLYWNNNKTFELPLSWYTNVKSWGTSPGFSSTHPNFNRFIGANCFECHSSFIGSQLNASTAGIEEVLDKNKLLYGIDCERCHGPAINHVNFHLDNPGSKEAKYITKIASLTRQQKLDVCAVCHSGNNKMQEKSTFKFRPGDTLSHFFVVWPSKDTAFNFDVHGNQYQLLTQSKCFTGSKIMDCSTCHNPHSNAGTDVRAYSSVCMSCHKGVTHSFASGAVAAQQLVNNCIDCHMPAQPSHAISFQTQSNGPKLAYLLRTHRIAVYKDPVKH